MWSLLSLVGLMRHTCPSHVPKQDHVCDTCMKTLIPLQQFLQSFCDERFFSSVNFVADQMCSATTVDCEIKKKLKTHTRGPRHVVSCSMRVDRLGSSGGDHPRGSTTPSALPELLNSSSEPAIARTATHPRRDHHHNRHACSTRFRIRSGSHMAVAFAK